MIVAIAGASGKLGKFITRHLLEESLRATSASSLPGQLKVRLLTREKEESIAKLGEFQGKPGVEIVPVDHSNTESLTAALQGCHTLLSTVSGDFPVVLDLQLRLLEAAIKAGVSRFSPSDYSLDFRNLTPGDNYYLDFRIKVAEILKAEEQAGRIKALHFLNGMFTDIVYLPFLGFLNEKESTFTCWGTGEERMDSTTYEDTARYVAAVVKTKDGLRSSEKKPVTMNSQPCTRNSLESL